MNKKLQVFVSSTYTDLKEERQAAVEAILKAEHIPAGMELFKSGKSQMETIRKWIDDSDVYMLILGGRYGSVEEDTKLSYTQLEYEYALSKNMPIFSIVLKDDFLKTKASTEGHSAIFEQDNINKYNSFKAKVTSKIVGFVSNIDQISKEISMQLNHILNDPSRNLIGWVRGDYATETMESFLPPDTIEDYYGSYLVLKNTKMHICPSCWFDKQKISPVSVGSFGKFICQKCGYEYKS